MTDSLLVVGVTALTLTVATGATAVCAAHIPYLARLTGAAPLDKEDQ